MADTCRDNCPACDAADAEQTVEKLYDLAELFKVFGDSTRVRILYEPILCHFHGFVENFLTL